MLKMHTKQKMNEIKDKVAAFDWISENSLDLIISDSCSGGIALYMLTDHGRDFSASGKDLLEAIQNAMEKGND